MRSLNAVKFLSPFPNFSMAVLLLTSSFMLSVGCGLITDSDDGNFDVSKISGFKVRIPPGGLQDDDFFPLQVGARWSYKLVHSQHDPNEFRSWTAEFTVSVTGTQTWRGREYFVVENYFVPGPELPTPTLMRKDGKRIYVRIEEEEYLLYSFAPEDTLWSLPLYMNPTWLIPRKAKRAIFTVLLYHRW